MVLDEEIGCPEGWEVQPLGCCLNPAWLDIDFSSIAPATPDPAGCPRGWEFIPEYNKCMPEWVTLPPFVPCEGDVTCLVGYSLSPDLSDTCIMDGWEEF